MHDKPKYWDLGVEPAKPSSKRARQASDLQYEFIKMVDSVRMPVRKFYYDSYGIFHPSDHITEEEAKRWLEDFGWDVVIRAFGYFCSNREGRCYWGDSPMLNFRMLVLWFCKSGVTYEESKAYYENKLSEQRMKELGLKPRIEKNPHLPNP